MIFQIVFWKSLFQCNSQKNIGQLNECFQNVFNFLKILTNLKIKILTLKFSKLLINLLNGLENIRTSLANDRRHTK